MTAETKLLAMQVNDDHSLPEGNHEEEELTLRPLTGGAKRWRNGEQTDPPRVVLSKFFPSGEYPEGEILEYGEGNAWHTSSEEKLYNERLAMEDPTFGAPPKFTDGFADTPGDS
ncbi:hypothetical protein BJ322DRAFT_699889 [Thelephora terrestris]|uniref:Uncharacterized protein n=1 Tax=Thelephora terrestris TaxID=56493 RepID=A0A9P6HH18_9AGAM|nr:hypothetical protein BJ322DRAFT_699889 [Thelephora terrestris]